MERNISLDLLKLMMACMIVGLHAGFLSEHSKLGEYLFVNGIFRIAVPVFFIINGFYFYTVLVKNSQLMWFKRVVILYLFWMAFYSFFWVYIPDMTFYGIVKIFIKFLIGYNHLWYISGMIGAAIIVLLLNNFSTKVIVFSIVITFLMGVFIQYSGNYHIFYGNVFDTLFNANSVHRNLLFFSFPFFSIGYLINKYSLYEIVPYEIAFLGAFLGMIFLLLESYVDYYQPYREGGFDNLFALIFVCPMIFMCFQKKYTHGNTKNISLYSSSIYFIHSLVLSVLRWYTEFEGASLTVIAIIASAIASIFIISLNKRVKYIL